jgi:hypothetical protein
MPASAAHPNTITRWDTISGAGVFLREMADEFDSLAG